LTIACKVISVITW